MFHAQWEEDGIKQDDIDAEFQNVVYVMLDWADILGDGYSTKTSDKLQEWYDKYSTKKYHKIEKYILKNYDDGSITYKELEQFIKDMFHYLESYIEVVKYNEENGNSDIYCKIDPDYYDYARQELDAWLDMGKDLEE